MKKTLFMVDRPLADMHGDGVRFDPKIKQALMSQRIQDDREPSSDKHVD